MGVGSGEGAVPPPQKKIFGIFSFEIFDAFWRTFRSTVIVTVMFITSPPRGLTKINMKSTVGNEYHFNTETC